MAESFSCSARSLSVAEAPSSRAEGVDKGLTKESCHPAEVRIESRRISVRKRAGGDMLLGLVTQY